MSLQMLKYFQILRNLTMATKDFQPKKKTKHFQVYAMVLLKIKVKCWSNLARIKQMIME